MILVPDAELVQTTICPPLVGVHEKKISTRAGLCSFVCSTDHRCWSCSHSFVSSISRKRFCHQLPSHLLRYVAIAIVHLVKKVLCSEERLLVQLVAVILVARSSTSLQLRSLPQVQIHLRSLEKFESSLSRLPYRTVPYPITHHRVNRSLFRTQNKPI
jgi:hypothetical protein